MMCFSVPGKVIHIRGDTAVVDYDGEQREASLKLRKDVAVGDYVIVSAKFVMEKVPEEDARKILAVWDKADGS